MDGRLQGRGLKSKQEDGQLHLGRKSTSKGLKPHLGD